MKIETMGGYGFKSFNQLNGLIGIPLFYRDEETGVGWDIEVFEIYREAMSDSSVLILTDNIKVRISSLDVVRGSQKVIETIYDGYKEAINNLEYTNG